MDAVQAEALQVYYREASDAYTGPPLSHALPVCWEDPAIASCDHTYVFIKFGKLSSWLRPLCSHSFISSVNAHVTVAIWPRRSGVRGTFNFGLVEHSYVVCHQFHVQWSSCKSFWFRNSFWNAPTTYCASSLGIVTQRYKARGCVPLWKRQCRGRETKSETYRARN